MRHIARNLFNHECQSCEQIFASTDLAAFMLTKLTRLTQVKGESNQGVENILSITLYHGTVL